VTPALNRAGRKAQLKVAQNAQRGVAAVRSPRHPAKRRRTAAERGLLLPAPGRSETIAADCYKKADFGS